MAKVYVSEYKYQPLDADGKVIVVGNEPALAYQTVAIGGGSLQSSAFNDSTRFIRVHTDAICSIKIGTNPTAVTTETRLAANQTEFFGVRGGMKIAVITNT